MPVDDPLISAAARRGIRQRQRTHTQVLDATERLLAECPWDTIKVENVAREAGVSPASVYGHFTSKDQLMTATIDRLLADMAASLPAALNTTTNPLARLRLIGTTYLQFLTAHPTIGAYFVVKGTPERETDADIAAAERLDRLRWDIEKLLQEAADQGQIRHVDSRLMSFFLIGAWNGIASLALRRDTGHLSPDEITAATVQAVNALFDGLAIPSPERG